MEFCAICERHIDWDGHTESAHLKDEVERLRAALEGQPVIKSEWEQKCEEVERLRAEIAWQEERNAMNVKAYQARIDAAVALHKPGPDGYCTECADPVWGECDTAKALKGEEEK